MNRGKNLTLNRAKNTSAVAPTRITRKLQAKQKKPVRKVAKQPGTKSQVVNNLGRKRQITRSQSEPLAKRTKLGTQKKTESKNISTRGRQNKKKAVEEDSDSLDNEDNHQDDDDEVEEELEEEDECVNDDEEEEGESEGSEGDFEEFRVNEDEVEDDDDNEEEESAEEL